MTDTTIEQQIDDYIAAQPDAKSGEMRALHQLVLGVAPDCRLWFLDGRNEQGKIVSNPNIGYGQRTIHYADGSSRDFYRIGLSANTSGLSIYVIGVEDKTLLARMFGERLGKASITGYCIRFRRLADVDPGVLEEVLRFGLGRD